MDKEVLPLERGRKKHGLYVLFFKGHVVKQLAFDLFPFLVMRSKRKRSDWPVGMFVKAIRFAFPF